MICPVEIAHEMSALRAVRVGDHAKHGILLEGRDGAGDESTGSDVAGHGEEDHVVSGSGDHGHQRPAHAAVAGALRGGGFRGLFDRRRGKPSPKRVPMAVVERVWELYREKYFDLNLRHFQEKLAGEHQMGLSYSWVKGVLQGAGLVARGRKRGGHCKRGERRPW